MSLLDRFPKNIQPEAPPGRPIRDGIGLDADDIPASGSHAVQEFPVPAADFQQPATPLHDLGGQVIPFPGGLVGIGRQPGGQFQAVAVGGSRHVGKGIITTASYEARRYGLHSGMAVRDAVQLCPHVIFVHPDFAKYVHVSQNVFRMLLEYTDRVEPVSVDEAYFDVSDVVWKEGGVEALAMKKKK